MDLWFPPTLKNILTSQPVESTSGLAVASPQLLSSAFEDVTVYHLPGSVAVQKASSTVEHVVQKSPSLRPGPWPLVFG